MKEYCIAIALFHAHAYFDARSLEAAARVREGLRANVLTAARTLARLVYRSASKSDVYV